MHEMLCEDDTMVACAWCSYGQYEFKCETEHVKYVNPMK